MYESCIFIGMVIVLFVSYRVGYSRGKKCAGWWHSSSNYAHATLLLKSVEDIKKGRPDHAASLLSTLANAWIEEWDKGGYSAAPASHKIDMTPAENLARLLKQTPSLAEKRSAPLPGEAAPDQK